MAPQRLDSWTEGELVFHLKRKVHSAWILPVLSMFLLWAGEQLVNPASLESY